MTEKKLTYKNLVFAKRCTNDHGHFRPGDKARGAFPPALIDTYVALGVLVPVTDAKSQKTEPYPVSAIDPG